MNIKILGASIALAGVSLAAEIPSAITGDYVEARSNHVYTCACLCNGEQETSGREAILAWDVTTGSRRGTSLAGVKIVAVVVSNRNLGMEATPRRSVLYLDGISSAAQREAAVALVAQEYGKAVGEIVTVHAAPIAFRRQGETLHLTAGDIVRLEIRPARLPEDAHPGSQVWYHPFVPVSDEVLGTTLYYQYSGKDLAQQWKVYEPGITGYLGRFTLPVS